MTWVVLVLMNVSCLSTVNQSTQFSLVVNVSHSNKFRTDNALKQADPLEWEDQWAVSVLLEIIF